MSLEPRGKKVLVLGDGDTALGLIENLLQNRFPVIFATPGKMPSNQAPPQGCEILERTQIEGLNGQVGEFEVSFSAGKKNLNRQIGFLAIAYESQCEPFYSDDKIFTHENILTAGEAEDILFKNNKFPPDVKSVILLDDPEGLSSTASSERIFKIALELRNKKGVNCHIVCSHVKVASRGLELFYSLVRNSGCLISKTEKRVDIKPQTKGLKIRFFDDILYEELILDGDMIIVGEDYLPSKELERLSEILALETGPLGFLQADNVFRETCLTNRRGVLVIGPSAQKVSRWEREQSIKAAAAEIHGLHEWLVRQDHPETVEYDRGSCAYCLTCYRACPHGAIQFTNRPHFLNLACQECGICVSACPGEALNLLKNKGESPAPEIKKIQTIGREQGKDSIFAFACGKSAAVILKNYSSESTSLPSIKWMEIPCAGFLRMTHILDSFISGNGIRGVLVLACHEGNCCSGKGTILAKRLVKDAKGILEKIGFKGERVEYISTAPNDAVNLKRKIESFRKSLSSLETANNESNAV
ncbi:hydrogenase iron-sulfur subunit [Thermodesulfobacteriota bacterium]